MKIMMNRVLWGLAFLLMTTINLKAESVKFTAVGPGAVVKGEQFRLVYTVNAEAKDLRAPDMPDFEVLMGPSKSYSSSVQVINGNVTSEISNSFTYILMASKEGTFTIPPATIVVEGKRFTSNPVVIKVLPPDKAAQAASGSRQRSNSSGGSSASASGGISSQNLFTRMTLSSHRVYEQQAVLSNIKIYSRYDLGIEGGKVAEYNGFLAEEIVDPNRQWTIENVNGTNYRAVTINQTVLYPQRAGKLSIGSSRFDLVVRVRNQQRQQSIFDDFFETYQDVKKVISTQPTTIEVMPLPPGKPASFTGAVGKFDISSSISTRKLRANEAVTVKITISGVGNMKLLKNPTVSFPSDFEIYDPKEKNNFKITTAGYKGSKVIEYLAIPRYAGNFTIPGVEFSYFDPQSGSYKTARTEDFKIEVAKGVGGSGQQVMSDYTNKESLKLLGQDIRFIKTNPFELTKTQSYFFGSLMYQLLYIVPFLLFVALFIIFRKKAKESTNLALMRTKKANKVATKRLKLGARFLNEKNHDAFYDEMLKAVWGYLSDKLSIPVSELTKENIEAELLRYGVGEELVRQYLQILDTCEFARYAPAKSTDAMAQTYEKTVDAIGQMEKIIKK